jgi:hypothetical protein
MVRRVTQSGARLPLRRSFRAGTLMEERVTARLAALRRHLDGFQDPPIDAATRLSLTPVSAPLGAFADKLAVYARAPPHWLSSRSGLGERPVPGGGKGTLMVKDSRTGNTYEIQVRRGRRLAFPAPAGSPPGVLDAAAACTATPVPPWAKRNEPQGR